MATDDRAAALAALLDELSGLGTMERQQRINRLQRDDPALAAEVASALALQETLLQPDGPSPLDVAALKLDRLGEFRVLSLIGQGGMGAVFLAEQDNPRRKVALKLMRQAGADAEAARRFRREGAALARLDHPGIARVYAAGVEQHALGALPYFAMEYVDGVSLIEHAAAHGLDQTARLRLLVAICQAVQHAHQRGVLHRDLKPANIMVDAAAQPRILDFGIARLLDDPEHGTRLTEIGQIVGTLPYMSPEQINGDEAAIDTRADVYSLGVILYELLSGKRPREFEPGTSLMQAVARAMRQPLIALAEVNPDCAGDLDTVTMKALAEDPAERYASASELAADIERYLHDQPILARPPSAWYVLQKFSRRHRALVGASVLGLTALILSTVIALNAAWREREAREAAERSAAIANSVRGFMNEMFQAAMPESALGREVSVREVVDQASLRLQNAPPEDPVVAAESGLALGAVNLALGRFDQAGSLVDGAIQLLTAQGTSAEKERFEAQILRLQITAAREADAAAEQGARDLVQEIQHSQGARSMLSLEASTLLADILLRQSKFKEAIDGYHQVLGAPLDVLPDDHRVREGALANLAVALRGSGDLPAAIAVLTALEQQVSRRRGPEHPATLSVLNNLAIAVQNSGDRESALALYDRAYAGRSKVLGASHPDTLNVLQNRATLLIESGKPAEAEPVLRQLLATLVETRQKNHPAVLVAMNSLAYALEDLGKLDEAETLYRETLAIQTESKSTYSESFSTRNNLAMLLMRQGDLVNAEREFITVLDATTETLGAEHPYVNIFGNNYGECLTRLGRYADAERMLLNTHARLAKALPPGHGRLVKARARLAELYDAMKQPERAADWRRPPPSSEVDSDRAAEAAPEQAPASSGL